MSIPSGLDARTPRDTNGLVSGNTKGTAPNSSAVSKPSFRRRSSGPKALITDDDSSPAESSSTPRHTGSSLVVSGGNMDSVDSRVPSLSGSSSSIPSPPPSFVSGPHTPGSASTPGTPRLSPLPPHLREWKPELSSRRSSVDSDISLAEEGEASPLLQREHAEDQGKWYQGPLFMAGVKLAVLFLLFTAVVAGTFYYGMPAVDPEDRPVLKLPKSFADLQALNSLFEKYKRQYPYRLLACGAVAYLFVQTFSLPGSMYISILFGAAYGLLWGLFLSCLCDSMGSVLCYTVSSLLAPPLLSMPFYRAKVETWRIKIMGDPTSGKEVSKLDIFAFLLILRISPFPPHWVCNCVAPHLGIGAGLFWTAAFIGIVPISVIHVTIGSSLDSMTSAADFHILSARNVFGLVAVVVAVLIPVGLKRVFKKDLGELGEAEAVLAEQGVQDVEVVVPAIHSIEDGSEGGTGTRYFAVDSGMILAGPSPGDESLHADAGARGVSGKGKGRPVEIFAHIAEEDEGNVGEETESSPSAIAAYPIPGEKGPRVVGQYGTLGHTVIGR